MIFQLLKNDDECYPRVSNVVLLAFCGYVLIWYLQIGYRVPALGAIRIEFIWALVLTAIALLSPNVSTMTDNPFSGVVILLFLVIAIQVPFSLNPEYSWNVFFNRVVKFAFMAFFIVSFVKSPKGLIFFIGAFMLACIKMGQEGLVGQISGSMVWQNQGIMRLHGSTPMYTHPNSFSGMALGTIPFIIYLFPIVPKIIKIILSVQLLFALNILIHTGSRTGYVAFIVMLIFFVLKSQKKLFALLVLVICILISTHFVNQQYFERFSTIFSGQEIEGNSIGARIQILEDAVTIFKEHPFGVGVAAFPIAREARFGRIQDTHNLYLEVATNLGIQGLIVFAAFIFIMLKTLKNICRNLEKNKNAISKALEDKEMLSAKRSRLKKLHADSQLCIALSTALTLFILVRLALGLFGMDLYEIYWWFSLGLSIAIFRIHRKILDASDEFLAKLAGKRRYCH
ncbi:O-antigen ligase family protein [Desulfofustis glycolicus]|uniref:O-antigen ligase n=1 Tax=Desulfofustis glycolicus DSM 9705 TaxID=1121409 RepID=A0A1M5YS74_9BACT|nr:O-antigen ligase family protein [Desulfofustis glycolicus]SHI14714.1 O-antigen ligase [Desulfofustis glycolicus DSM 9705]